MFKCVSLPCIDTLKFNARLYPSSAPVGQGRSPCTRLIGVALCPRKSAIALPADPNDGQYYDVSAAGLERGLLARELRLLWARLGLTLATSAARYGIPEHKYASYESVRTAPPAAAMAYLRVIIAEPERGCARTVKRAA